MAGYDPKRPRPVAGGDEPAPVEALLDPELSDQAAADADADTDTADGSGATPVVESADADADADAAVGAGEATEDAVPVAEPGVTAPEPDSVPEPVEAPGDAEPVDRHLRAVAASDSTVPVADRPPEPAANRAVAFVGIGVAALVALLLLLLLRRRRR